MFDGDPKAVKWDICSKCLGFKSWNYWYHNDESLCDDCYYSNAKYYNLSSEEAQVLQKIKTAKNPPEMGFDMGIKEYYDLSHVVRGSIFDDEAQSILRFGVLIVRDSGKLKSLLNVVEKAGYNIDEVKVLHNIEKIVEESGYNF